MRRRYERSSSARQILILLSALVLPLGPAILPACQAAAQDADPPYAHPLFTAPAREAPTPTFDQEHLRLALRIDPARQSIDGDATLRLRPLDAVLDSLVLFAAGLAIDSVWIGTVDSAMVATTFYPGDGDTLVIALDSLHSYVDPFDVRIAYTAQPQRGLYVITPSDEAPSLRRQVWTSSQPDAFRHWMPVLDVPGDKTTSELLITVPPLLRVLSNGRLLEERTDEDGQVTFHYLQDQPHPVHLIALAAGEYEIVEETVRLPNRNTAVSLSAWIYPEHVGDVQRTFGQTSEMIRFCSERLGVAYPWASYSQAVLQQLPTEHMASTSTAFFTDRVVLDERAALTHHSDAVLAQALAQQWIGSLVTPHYWNDRWLSDGLASYLSALFLEARAGRSALEEMLLDYRERYLAEAPAYRRPLVWDRWSYPGQLDDAHSSAKGAWVFHMLRRHLGDETFWRVLERFLDTYALKTVETEHLEQTVEAVADVEIKAFFDEWVYAAGHPVLDVSYRYLPDDETLTLTVTQQQTGPLVPEVFHTPFSVEVYTFTESHRFDLFLDARLQRFSVPLSAPPRFVAVDTDQAVLAEIHVEQNARAWMGQLRRASSETSRIEAARAMAAFGGDPALAIGLRSALQQEPSATVRRAIAATLDRLPPSSTIERILRDAIDDDDATVRAAIVEALAAYPHTATHELAFDRAQHDPSYLVQATAVQTLARTGSPNALDVIRSALITPSHRELIRVAALDALALLDLPAREGLDVALPYTEADQPFEVRRAALRYLRTLALSTRSAFRRLAAILSDDDLRVRQAAIDALGAIGSSQAREALVQHRDREPEPSLQIAIAQWLRASSSE